MCEACAPALWLPQGAGADSDQGPRTAYRPVCGGAQVARGRLRVALLRHRRTMVVVVVVVACGRALTAD